MSDKVERMFYFGAVPWHGKGTKVETLLNLKDALRLGGLEWDVQTEPIYCLTTADRRGPTLFEPGVDWTRVKQRKALVRGDLKPGNPDRVLGVVHQGFRPLQNREGAAVFDGLFGGGRRVYETGGCLREGKQVWLLAQLQRDFEVVKNDRVECYALFANSHDGSISIRIRLTTVRVVCWNTLTMALSKRGKDELHFRHAHSLSAAELREQASRFFAEVEEATELTAARFRRLAARRASADGVTEFMNEWLPLPKRPERASRPVTLESYVERLEEVTARREKVMRLFVEGRGNDLPGVRGSYWALLNAVTEALDHPTGEDTVNPGDALFGPAMAAKQRALHVIDSLVGVG